MAYLRVNKFGKSVTCPPVETHLRFVSGMLTAKQYEQIAAHMSACDFCGAEVQLLSKNPPPHCVVTFPHAEMPPHLQTLATECLTTRKKK